MRWHGGLSVRLSMAADDPGTHYCPDCAQALLHCAACRAPLGDTAGHLFALSGDRARLYCADCWARPHCDACGRPVGRRPYQRPTGGYCADPVTRRPSTTRRRRPALYEQVRRAAQVLGLHLGVGAPLYLATREQIGELRTTAPGKTLPAERPGRRIMSACSYIWGIAGGLCRVWPAADFFLRGGGPRVRARLAGGAAPYWAIPSCAKVLRNGLPIRVVESWGCRLRLARFRERQNLTAPVYGASLPGKRPRVLPARWTGFSETVAGREWRGPAA